MCSCVWLYICVFRCVCLCLWLSFVFRTFLCDIGRFCICVHMFLCLLLWIYLSVCLSSSPPPTFLCVFVEMWHGEFWISMIHFSPMVKSFHLLKELYFNIYIKSILLFIWKSVFINDLPKEKNIDVLVSVCVFACVPKDY